MSYNNEERDYRDDRQPYPNQNQENNRYQYRNNRPFNHNKFNPTKQFNPNVINELRDKNVKITWKNKESNDWEYFKVLNSFYAYGEGWMKLSAMDSGKNDDIPQELLDNPLFIRIDDIKYFMIIKEN
jgi:hypothetical protein